MSEDGASKYIQVTHSDLEPDIKITEAELAPDIQIMNDELANSPEIRITRKDLARNPLEWLQATYRDTRERLTDNLNWWGNMAKQKLDAYKRVDRERRDVEGIVVTILNTRGEKEPQSWETLTERDLGDAESEAIGLTKEELLSELTLTLEELDRGVRPDRTAIQQYIRELSQLHERQAAEANRIYGSREFSTPIRMENHRSQQYLFRAKDGRSISTCVIASTLNGLTALGIAQSQETEDTVIDAIGGVREFDERGYLEMGKVEGYLRERGTRLSRSGNILELLQSLENGGVAIIAYGGHARLISGAESQNGQVMLREHDPLNTNVRLVPVSEMVTRVNSTEMYLNLLLIERNPSSVR